MLVTEPLTLLAFFGEAVLMMELPKRHSTPSEGGRFAPITLLAEATKVLEASVASTGQRTKPGCHAITLPMKRGTQRPKDPKARHDPSLLASELGIS